MSANGSIAAVVLAAGASRRLGRPKQSLEIGGETLLERAVRVAVEARLEPVIVVVRDPGVASVLGGCEVVVRDPGVASVLGDCEVVVRDPGVASVLGGCEVVVRDAGVARGLRGCEIVSNALADEGMASSIRVGVARAQELGVVGVVVMACDQVALRTEHLRALCGEVDRITGSGYAGKVGIPAYFPAEKFGELMELQGDVGARELLRGAVAVVDEGLGLDVDTEADVDRAVRMLG